MSQETNQEKKNSRCNLICSTNFDATPVVLKAPHRHSNWELSNSGCNPSSKNNQDINYPIMVVLYLIELD